jgi:hypothetical protein
MKQPKPQLIALWALASLSTGASFTLNAPLNNVAIPSKTSVTTCFAETVTSKPCDMPEGFDDVPSLVSQKGSGKILRSQTVTNSEGELISLGDAMGKGKSIVIFLRHMG